MSTSHSTLNERRKAKSSPKRAFLMWLGYEDSNLGMPESESGALPLGDTPTGRTYDVSVLNKLAGVRGFEPRNAGIRIRCLTAWRYPNKLVFEFAERIRHIQNLVATTGFEPVTPESESGALPLGDTPTGRTYDVSVLNKWFLNLPNVFDTFRIWWLRRDSNL